MLSGGNGECPPAATIEAALDWIDDPVGLLGDRPVRVAELWRTVVATLLGPECESVVVVHPDDWAQARVDRVVAAANAVADRVEAVTRSAWVSNRTISGVEPHPEFARARRPRPFGAPVLAVGLTVAGALGAAGIGVLGHRDQDVPPSASASAGEDVRPAPEVRTVTDGRVAVRIPRSWSVVRVMSGVGSRRLQIDSPDEPGVALHITQAYVPGTTLSRAADVVARAIAGESPGVFVDFQSDGEVAGRAAVIYREVRPGRAISWSVVIDGSTRVGIGCESPHGRASAVRAACDEAVRSAREQLGTDSRR